MDSTLSDTDYIARTKSEANELTSGLHTVNSLSFTLGKTIEQAIRETFPYDMAHKIFTICQKNNIDVSNSSSVQAFLQELSKQVETLPVVTIQIAFSPKERTLNAIYNWFLYQLKKQVLLDIQVDPRLIGSATLSYKGNFKDYSLSKKLQETPVQETPS